MRLTRLAFLKQIGLHKRVGLLQVRKVSHEGEACVWCVAAGLNCAHAGLSIDCGQTHLHYSMWANLPASHACLHDAHYPCVQALAYPQDLFAQDFPAFASYCSKHVAVTRHYEAVIWQASPYMVRSDCSQPPTIRSRSQSTISGPAARGRVVHPAALQARAELSMAAHVGRMEQVGG